MFLTFNTGMQYDSEEFGSFDSWAISMIGEKRYKEAVIKSDPKDFYYVLWKMVATNRHDLKPIGRFFEGNIVFNNVGSTIIGVATADEADNFDKFLTEYSNLDTGITLYWILKWKYKIAILLESEISAYRISKETGVPESTIKNYRKRFENESLDFMPIGNLKKLMEFPDLDKLVNEYKDKNNN